MHSYISGKLQVDSAYFITVLIQGERVSIIFTLVWGKILAQIFMCLEPV